MDNIQARPLAVRRAAAADAAALARLREVMLSDMGMLAAGAKARPGCATSTPRERATPVECRGSSST